MARHTQSHGRGHLYNASGKWYVRYREDVLENGEVVNRQVSSPPLALVADVRNKGDARSLADEYLNNLRQHAPSALGTMELIPFVDTVYLPWVKSQKSASTHNGYAKMWEGYFKPRLRGVRLRDFATSDGEKLLQRIATERDEDESQLSHETLKHLKSFMSGVFTHAKRQGYINGVNPIQGVSIPAGAESQDTYAYSLDEELTMIASLTGPAQLAVAIASFTGLSLAEIKGLDWSDYSGETIKVRRNKWRNVIGKPKTKKRRGSVPVIDYLRRYLDMWPKREGWVLQNELGEALNLDWTTRSVIIPTLKAAGVAWHGWHAFRRGLATNLDRLGVPDTVIQAILRHSNVAVTRQSYIKEVRADAVDAMQKLDEALRLQGEKKEVVN